MRESQLKKGNSLIWEKPWEWQLRTLLVVAACAVIVLLFRLNILQRGVFFREGEIVFPLSDAFIILGAGLCGYQYGIGMFLMIILNEGFFRDNAVGIVGLFPLFLYLALAILTGLLTQNRMFRDIKRTALSFIILESVLSSLFYLIFVVLFRGSDMNFAETVLATFPECAVAVAGLYLYYRYAPDRIKNSFGAGMFYASDYDVDAAKEAYANFGYLMIRITILSVVEGIVLSSIIVNITHSMTFTFEEEAEEIWNIYNRDVALFLLALTVTFSVVLIVNEAILGIVSNVIRKQQQLETELLVAKARSDAKSTFLSNMSHEIRTPINAVLGMNEMILRESGEESTLTYAESVKTAGNTLLGLVNDILDFSKIEAGKMDIIPVEYRLSSVLNDLINMTKARAEEKDLDFEISVDPDIPDTLFGDEIRIKQIVTNILTNAVKYTRQGKVKMLVGFEGWGGEEIELRFIIKDTGIGIKKENIDKLFTAFERIEEERNRTIEGTGLGMNITHRLVTLMDGDIHVASEYGKGSAFTFTVTQKVMDHTPIGDYEEAYRRSMASHKKYHESFTAPDARVLVVDDTEMNLVVFKGLLKKTGVQIDTAKSGYAALEKTRKNKYDLIFLDHRMPDKDGIETLADVKAQDDGKNQETPIVCLTANAVSGAREEYLAAGFTDYLTKPVDPDALEKMMIIQLPDEKVGHITVESTEDKAVSFGADKDTSDHENDIQKSYRNMEGYMQEALGIYLESLDENASEIERMYEACEWKNYGIKVHSLKSTSRMVGEHKLGDLAERLEHAADERDVSVIHANHGTMLQQYRAVKVKYGFLLSEKELPNSDEFSAGEEVASNPNKNAITDEMWNGAMTAIRELAQAFDADAIEDILMQIEDFALSERQREIAEKVKLAVRNLDWDSIKI